MICLDDDFCMGELNQMTDFFDHPNKTCNLELCWSIVFLRNSEEPRDKED